MFKTEFILKLIELSEWWIGPSWNLCPHETTGNLRNAGVFQCLKDGSNPLSYFQLVEIVCMSIHSEINSGFLVKLLLEAWHTKLILLTSIWWAYFSFPILNANEVLFCLNALVEATFMEKDQRRLFMLLLKLRKRIRMFSEQCRSF